MQNRKANVNKDKLKGHTLAAKIQDAEGYWRGNSKVFKSQVKDLFRRKLTSDSNCFHKILLNILWWTLVLLQDLRTSAGGGSKQTNEFPGFLLSVRLHSSICEDQYCVCHYFCYSELDN